MGSLRESKYILDGDNNPQPCPDVIRWGTWFEAADRRVGQHENELWRVSTVFLGMDHQFGDGPPLIFETMVFAKDKDGHDEICDRYSTWDQAVEGHKKHCKTWLKELGELAGFTRKSWTENGEGTAA